jgi:acyl carrier protein
MALQTLMPSIDNGDQMDDTQKRLIKCFSVVFPGLQEKAIMHADTSNTEGWDSVASVTLFALIEEEFGIELDVQALGQLTSFEQIREHLQARK